MEKGRVVEPERVLAVARLLRELALELLELGQIPLERSRIPLERIEGARELPDRVIASGERGEVDLRRRLEPHALDPRVADVVRDAAHLLLPALDIGHEARVRRAPPGHRDARRDEPVRAVLVRARDLALERRADVVEHVVRARHRGRVDVDRGPAHDVERAVLDPRDALSVHGHEARALRSGLLRVASLEVPREHDPRILGHDLARVDVPERPVVVALAPQRLHRRRRVRRVTLAPRQRRVKEAHVEEPRARVRISRGDVLRDLLRREALAVHREPELLVDHGHRLAGRELGDVVRQAELARDAALRVVVASHEKDAEPRLAELGHLSDEEEPRRVVAPIAVVEVAREHHRIRALLDRERDEVLHRPSSRPADPVGRRPLVAVEPRERAVDVQIRGVDELHVRSLPSRRETHLSRPN